MQVYNIVTCYIVKKKGKKMRQQEKKNLTIVYVVLSILLFLFTALFVAGIFKVSYRQMIISLVTSANSAIESRALSGEEHIAKVFVCLVVFSTFMLVILCFALTISVEKKRKTRQICERLLSYDKPKKVYPLDLDTDDFIDYLYNSSSFKAILDKDDDVVNIFINLKNDNDVLFEVLEKEDFFKYYEII